ncbi:hypothetical protein [Natronospora cellulosivora (SeqCode)]
MSQINEDGSTSFPVGDGGLEESLSFDLEDNNELKECSNIVFNDARDNNSTGNYYKATVGVKVDKEGVEEYIRFESEIVFLNKIV